MVAKRLEILRELVPGAARVAVLVNPDDTKTETTMREVRWLPARWGCTFRSSKPAQAARSMASLATIARERPDALFVEGNALFSVAAPN